MVLLRIVLGLTLLLSLTPAWAWGAGELFVQRAHNAKVTSLAFSPSSRLLASAADDGTVRVWDVVQRRELRSYAAPHVDSVTWLGEDHLLVERRGAAVITHVATGRERGVLGDHVWRPERIVYAVIDGKPRLFGPSGVSQVPSVFDLDGSRLGYLLYPPADERGIDRLGAGDRAERFTEADPHFRRHCAYLTANRRGHVAVRCDADLVSGGSRSAAQKGDAKTTIAVLSVGADLALRRLWRQPIPRVQDLERVELSADGRSLTFVADRSRLRVTAEGAKKRPRSKPAPTDYLRLRHPCIGGHDVQEVTEVARSGDGRWLARATALGEIQLSSLRSSASPRLLGARARVPSSVAFTAAGLELRGVCGTSTWSLTTGKRIGFEPAPGLTAADPGARQLLGRQLSSASHDRDGRPTPEVVDGARRYVGTAHGELVIRQGGREIARSKGDGIALTHLALSPDDELVVGINAAGAAVIWGAEDARLRGVMLDFADDEWVTIAPDGAFVGTPEVSDRIGWVFSSPLEFFSYDHFAHLQSRQRHVARQLRGEARSPVTALRRPPRVTVTSHQQEDPSSLSVEYAIGDGSKAERLIAFNEGRVVKRVELGEDPEGTVEIPLRPGTTYASVVVVDAAEAISNPAAIALPDRAAASSRQALHVVAIGIGSYPEIVSRVDVSADERAAMSRRFQLPAAPGDARATVKALRKRARGKVHTKTLVDAQATPDAILTALRGLSRMKPEDLAVVSFSGHGLRTRTGEMVLATSKVELDEQGQRLTEESLAAATVSWTDVAAALRGAKGRVLLLLDACHAGSFTRAQITPNDRLAAALSDGGGGDIVVFAASKGRQVSLEPTTDRGVRVVRRGAKASASERSGLSARGLFTGAFLEVLADPAADRDSDGLLSFREVADEVTHRVSHRSRGVQTPWLVRRSVFGDFALAPASTTPGPQAAAKREQLVSEDGKTPIETRLRAIPFASPWVDGDGALTRATQICAARAPELEAVEAKCRKLEERLDEHVERREERRHDSKQGREPSRSVEPWVFRKEAETFCEAEARDAVQTAVARCGKVTAPLGSSPAEGERSE